MRTALLGIAVAALGVSAIAEAALPPRYQRQRELAQVIDEASRTLVEPIDQVSYVGEDRYRVLAGRCAVIARIVSLPSVPMMSGPRKFTVRLGRAVCR